MPTRVTGLRVYAAAAALAVTLAAPLSAASAASSALANIRIDNFGSVSETYYRGAQPEGDDWAALAAIGIKTVIDLQADGDAAEQGYVEKQGMSFVRIPMTTRVTPTKDQLAQFLALVNDPAKQPVYVHCAGGRHRTGVMTAVYRMTNDGWDGRKAFEEMKNYKFGADFLHPEFKSFVLGFAAPVQVPPVQPSIAVTVN